MTTNYFIAQSNRLGNREMNQDRSAISESDDSLLMVLADGMGGVPGGEVAAQITIHTIVSLFEKVAKPIASPLTFLRHTLNAAHQNILRSVENPEDNRIPGTTCVACIIQNGIAWWAHIGDSRLYILRNNEVIFRTQDHSFVEELRQRGEISARDMLTHPDRNYLTRCLGGSLAQPEITCAGDFALQKNDTFILCSDGLWSPLEDYDIESFLLSEDLEECVDNLAAEAETRSYPNSDNISILALRCIEHIPQKQGQQSGNADAARVADDLNAAIDEVEKALSRYENEIDPH
jgi:serine/threonine protein phosphatase PrpC